MQRSLWDYDPSARCHMLLRSIGIRTPGQLRRRNLEAISRLPGFGRATIYEIACMKQRIELEARKAPVADQAVLVAQMTLQKLTECGTIKTRAIAVLALLEISEILAGEK